MFYDTNLLLSFRKVSPRRLKLLGVHLWVGFLEENEGTTSRFRLRQLLVWLSSFLVGLALLLLLLFFTPLSLLLLFLCLRVLGLFLKRVSVYSFTWTLHT